MQPVGVGDFMPVGDAHRFHPLLQDLARGDRLFGAANRVHRSHVEGEEGGKRTRQRAAAATVVSMRVNAAVGSGMVPQLHIIRLNRAEKVPRAISIFHIIGTLGGVAWEFSAPRETRPGRPFSREFLA